MSDKGSAVGVLAGEVYDVVVIGGGPAGLQATLMLARSRRKIRVFDAAEPPRNAASHGVHNFIGLDGLTPAEIRGSVWREIHVYEGVDLCREHVVDLKRSPGKGFLVVGESGTAAIAKHVILALGYRDLYPNVPGFVECWGNTVIPCPYCDGYENRDRRWGLVANSELALEHMPRIYRNWTSRAELFLYPRIEIDAALSTELDAHGIQVHRGRIAAVEHVDGRAQSVRLDSGSRVEVDTLWWRPDDEPQPLTKKIIRDFDLELEESGSIKTDVQFQTSVDGLWAVGDVLGWVGALTAAYQASQAAIAISTTKRE